MGLGLGLGLGVGLGVGVRGGVRSICGAHLQLKLPPAATALDLVQTEAVVELLLACRALHVILVA